MLLVSPELTLPESHRSGFASCASLDATRISYADCRPLGSRQLRFGVASPSPIGLLNVFTRSVVGATLAPAGSAGATVLIASGTAPRMTSEAARRPMTLVLKFSSLILRGRSAPQTIYFDQTATIRNEVPRSRPGKSLDQAMSGRGRETL